MTAPRHLVLVALAAVAAMALLALFLGVGRESQMRDAEADFLARLRQGDMPARPAPPKPAAVPAQAAASDEDMAEWYAGASEPSAPEPPDGTGAAP